MARSQAERSVILARRRYHRMEQQQKGILAHIAALASGRNTVAEMATVPPHLPTAMQREELAHWWHDLAVLERQMAQVHRVAYPQVYRDGNERTA